MNKWNEERTTEIHAEVAVAQAPNCVCAIAFSYPFVLNAFVLIHVQVFYVCTFIHSPFLSLKYNPDNSSS